MKELKNSCVSSNDEILNMNLSNQSAVRDLCQWFWNKAAQGEVIFEIISRLNQDISSGEALSSLMSTMEDLFTEVGRQ
jgi:hypothetical protein